MTPQKETLDPLCMLEWMLASERVEWEREWKFSMRAAEDAILFLGGAPEIGFCLEPNEFSTGRMRAIEAGERQTKELERWLGWRHRQTKGQPAKPIGAWEKRDIRCWWNGWGDEWWRSAGDGTNPPDPEEQYYWLLAWAKVQAVKFRVWWYEVGSFEGVMGQIYHDFKSDNSDVRPPGVVGNLIYEKFRSEEKARRYAVVGTAAKFRWWRWWCDCEVDTNDFPIFGPQQPLWSPTMSDERTTCGRFDDDKPAVPPEPLSVSETELDDESDFELDSLEDCS